jgi:hypothetical protein
MFASHWLEVGPVASLAVIVAVLAVTVGASLVVRRSHSR